MAIRSAGGGRFGRCAILWALGVVAALSLLAAPLEMLQPSGLGFAWWQFRLLALVNPLLLLTLAVATGCWAAPRVGLAAPVAAALAARHPAGPVLQRQWRPALLGGIASALVLFAYARLTAPLFAAAPQAPSLTLPLASKLLYGGVVEELMLRWGVMSVAVWAGWRLSRRAVVGDGAVWAGNAVAALLFAAGHLPLLYTLLPAPPPALIAAVVVGNALPGLVFGWLFWRRGLEAAMLAHGLGHLLFTLGAASAG